MLRNYMPTTMSVCSFTSAMSVHEAMLARFAPIGQTKQHRIST